MRGIAVAADGRIIIPEGINDRVQVFNAAGMHLENWQLPVGDSYARAAIGEDGSMFVTGASDAVYKLALDGTYLAMLSIPDLH